MDRYIDKKREMAIVEGDQILMSNQSGTSAEGPIVMAILLNTAIAQPAVNLCPTFPEVEPLSVKVPSVQSLQCNSATCAPRR